LQRISCPQRADPIGGGTGRAPLQVVTRRAAESSAAGERRALPVHRAGLTRLQCLCPLRRCGGWSLEHHVVIGGGLLDPRREQRLLRAGVGEGVLQRASPSAPCPSHAGNEHPERTVGRGGRQLRRHGGERSPSRHPEPLLCRWRGPVKEQIDQRPGGRLWGWETLGKSVKVPEVYAWWD
jgi:hypothetical protein